MSKQMEAPSQSSFASKFLQPTIRLGLALLVLFVAQSVLVELPGVERVVLDPDITVATLLYGLITLVMFGAVLNYASTIGTRLGRTYPSIPDIKQIAVLIAGLIVIIWAYQTFWWLPFFRTEPVIYEYMFLGLGLLVGGWLGFLIYKNLDTISQIISGQVANAGGVGAVSHHDDLHDTDSQQRSDE